MKIDKKYEGILIATLMALSMATVMSFAMTLVNVGFNSHTLSAFARGWSIAIVVALPTGLILTPNIRKLVSRLVN